VFEFVQRPLDWVLLLLLIALVLFWRGRVRGARRAVVATTVLLLLFGIRAVPELIVQRLENAFPATTRSPAEFEGVVGLGGGLDGGVNAVSHGQTALTGAAERMTTALILARKYPALKIVLTGYAGIFEPSTHSEAAAAVRFFEEQGAPTTQLILEPTARNTSEIAQNTRNLPGVDPSKPWLLLTSAWNMPRALLSFRKAGWNVEPLPVDFATGPVTPWFEYSVARGVGAWSLVLHEVVGIVWYRLTGRL
jgi:uncharacterized SAM-binding protein YcdF (DUF218 family)